MSARFEGIKPAATQVLNVGIEQCTLLPLRKSMGETIGGGGETERRELQWNLRIKDTLGAELLSSFRRLSSGGRFKSICNYSHIKNS